MGPSSGQNIWVDSAKLKDWNIGKWHVARFLNFKSFSLSKSIPLTVFHLKNNPKSASKV